MFGQASARIPACPEGEAGAVAVVDARAQKARLEAVVRSHYAFLWRSLRRLGVAEREADDAAQRVLGVLARRIGEITAGSERSFLFQTALRVAAEMRRSTARARLAFDEATVDRARDEAPLPDEALEQREARAILDQVLDALPLEVRAVFVLFELEQLTTSEIADLLAIPAGTVSSRLRRGREEFQTLARRLRAQRAFAGADR